MTPYCNINPERKEHLLKLIDFLHQEVLSACGDGDGLWYSKYYDIKDILPLVEEYNSKLKFPWKITVDAKTIHMDDNQESLMITNDEELYKNAPSWQQILIKY